MQTRHNKPKAEGESGQITQNESPIHHSNVMLYSQDQKVRSKVGYRYTYTALRGWLASNQHTCSIRLLSVWCYTWHVLIEMRWGYNGLAVMLLCNKQARSM